MLMLMLIISNGRWLPCPAWVSMEIPNANRTYMRCVVRANPVLGLTCAAA